MSLIQDTIEDLFGDPSSIEIAGDFVERAIEISARSPYSLTEVIGAMLSVCYKIDHIKRFGSVKFSARQAGKVLKRLRPLG